MRAINFRPDKTWRLALAFLPFAFLCLAYITGSGIRLAENPNDKLLPSFSKMGEAIDAYALKPDARTGDYLLWEDTTASMTRLVARSHDLDGDCAGAGHRHRAAARRGSHSWPCRLGSIDGAAAGASAHPVHRHGAGL